MSICLCMIVKDESHIIVDTLRHLLKYIKLDYWVISDTGSTDGTQDLIRNFFQEQGIPGELDETPWKNFGYNRTVAFQKAYGKSDYVFVWDADDEIVGDFRMPSPLTADVYQFIFGNDTGFRYSRNQLFNNKKRWRYVGVLHEYPAEAEGETVGSAVHVSGNYYFVSGRKGSRNKDPLKYQKDAKVLEQGMIEEPENTRYVFYCANSYMSAGMYEDAIRVYKKNLQMNGWTQERYISCLEIFDCYEKLGTPELGLPYLVESYKYSPTRVECIYRLVKYYCVKGMNEIALLYYSLIREYYENQYLKNRDISTHLFVKQDNYDFFLPYYMIIVSLRLNNHALTAKMYDMLFQIRYMYADDWFMTNVFFNLQFLVSSKQFPSNNQLFLENMVTYCTMLHERGYKYTPEIYTILGNAIDQFRPLLTTALKTPPALTNKTGKKNAVKVLMTFTTCKRLDLFQKTMNSIFHTWTDLGLVDYFFCVDDNSSAKDRMAMRKMYPFFDYYFKKETEKGHRESMNIIWRKIKELQPTYWIHMEDDWLFFKADNYVKRSMDFLERYESKDIHQILFNRNYTETFDWGINGGELLEKGFMVHVKSDTIPGRSSGYWPHYSFRPSMVRASKILELGNYNSPNTFFERDYADRYFEKGYKSAFYDQIVSLHIGKLTSDKSGTNAYSLNAESQFGSQGDVRPAQPMSAEQKIPTDTFVVNLKRRPDRREAIAKHFVEHKITDFAFVEAVDGKELTVTPELVKLFAGNDFGSRRGFIGCALSHYKLWLQLANDKDHEYYIIFEDDITLGENFKEKLDQLRGKVTQDMDLLYLGHTVWNDAEKTVVLPEGDNSITPLKIDNYVGGFFGYIITKTGAQKHNVYIEKHGIKHGIDYLIKIIPNMNSYNVQPHIVFTEWVRNMNSTADSDIQKDLDSLDLRVSTLEDWEFHPAVDSIGEDIKFVGRKSVEELIQIANATPGCVAFNTLGFMKSQVKIPFVTSHYVQAPDGIYVHKRVIMEKMQEMKRRLEAKEQALSEKKLRCKLLCNWQSSEEACKEFGKMSKGDRTWNNIEITSEDTNIDYYIILNHPRPGDSYDPKKSLVFHMEPWCGEDWQKWGVKTWGEWANPDPTKFFHVHTNARYRTIGFWTMDVSYTTLSSPEFATSVTPSVSISSILSQKINDPGHKLRVNFIRFLESKQDPTIPIHVYGRENYHNLQSYKGVVGDKKEDKILAHKYYLMAENNSEKNYVTEKLWEAILCERLCFYWGCPNITDSVDSRAFVQLDMNDFEASYQKIKLAVATNLWEQRLPFIRAAKKKFLESYSFFPTIEQCIQTGGA